MDVSFIGYEESIITFKANGTINAGDLVAVSGNGEVSACAADDVFCGIAVDMRNGYVSVQMKGYVEIAYTGTAPDFGYAVLAAGSVNSVEVSAEGKTVLVVNKDTVNSKVGIIL